MTKADRRHGDGACVLDQVAQVERHGPDDREREADDQVAHALFGAAIKLSMPI